MKNKMNATITQYGKPFALRVLRHFTIYMTLMIIVRALVHITN